MMGAMRQTMPIAKAEYIATQFDDGEFIAAVEDAKNLGLATVEVVTTDDEIYLLRPKTIMIAWKPRKFERKRISFDGGTECEDVHMTLVYLGDVDDYSIEQQRTILGVVTEVAQRTKRIEGRMNAFGRFYDGGEDGDALWISGEFRGLREFRDELVQGLRDAGIEWTDTHPDFKPHITVGYLEAGAETPKMGIEPYDTLIDNATVYIGGLEYCIELDGPEWGPRDVPHEPYFDGENGNLYIPLLKGAAQPVLKQELRYTYGPWYVPESVDLHKEWATRDHVQEALWKYVDRGDRDIRLQHNTDVVAGRWVELATMPFPVETFVDNGQGVLVKHAYPAGTPFMGVIWEEWAWPLVKDGKIRGFSIGGTAQRVEVDLPGAQPPA